MDDLIMMLIIAVLTIPIISEKGFLKKIIHVVIPDRCQQNEFIRSLSPDFTVYYNKNDVSNVKLMLMERSAGVISYVSPAGKASANLENFVEQVFSVSDMHGFPIVISSGLITGEVSRDFCTIFTTSFDYTRIPCIDYQAVPDHEDIIEVLEEWKETEKIEAKDLFTAYAQIYGAYLRRHGVDGEMVTDRIRQLTSTFEPCGSLDSLGDIPVLFCDLLIRWLKNGAEIVDLPYFEDKESMRKENRGFYRSNYLYLSREALADIFRPLSGSFNRRDIMNALVNAGLLVRTNSRDFTSRMNFISKDVVEAASMYKIKVDGIEEDCIDWIS